MVGRYGKPDDSALVFPNVDRGYLSNTTILRRELYPAMVAAGIPREGPTGEKRTFHSLRHTFAKRALENGRQITWLSRHLGHSSPPASAWRPPSGRVLAAIGSGDDRRLRSRGATSRLQPVPALQPDQTIAAFPLASARKMERAPDPELGGEGARSPPSGRQHQPSGHQQ